MWIAGRKWWDFTSFDPRMPKPLDLYVQRVERDDEYIVNLEAEIVKFAATFKPQCHSIVVPFGRRRFTRLSGNAG